MAVVLLAVAASCVQGPVTGGTGITLGTGPELSQLGYRADEFFLTGIARSYHLTAPIPTDGKLQLAADPTTNDGAYRTRMVVLRPTDSTKFNGTVYVEWLNVSAGSDVASDWLMAHNEFVRQGAVYVGVSAQKVGVDQLRNSSGNPRYSDLVHPGDSFSYDIYSQAAIQIRNSSAQVLSGLTPQRLIGVGESQSAGRLVTYIDGVQPLEHRFDGFMVHSRFANGASITQAPLASVPFNSPAPIRDDLDVPVMVVEAEGDTIQSGLGARQPDTPLFRLWELAGTSHADAYTVLVGGKDIGDGFGARRMLELMQAPLDIGCALPLNSGPHHWQLQAAFHHLEAWVRDHSVTPPTAPLLQVASTGPVTLARDSAGNALGGVRSPQVDAPVATLSAVNSGSGFCGLFGSTAPFSSADLLARYPTHQAFVQAWVGAVYGAVANGWLLPVDGVELAQAAAGSTIPN